MKKLKKKSTKKKRKKNLVNQPNSLLKFNIHEAQINIHEAHRNHDNLIKKSKKYIFMKLNLNQSNNKTEIQSQLIQY